jgi:hypothetical protein
LRMLPQLDDSDLSKMRSSAAGMVHKRISWHLAPLVHCFPVPLDTLIELHVVVISQWLRFNLAMETPKPLQSRHAARCARKSSNVALFNNYSSHSLSLSLKGVLLVYPTQLHRSRTCTRAFPSAENGFHYDRLLRSHTSTSCVCSLKVRTALPSASTGHELRRRSQRP